MTSSPFWGCQPNRRVNSTAPVRQSPRPLAQEDDDGLPVQEPSLPRLPAIQSQPVVDPPPGGKEHTSTRNDSECYPGASGMGSRDFISWSPASSACAPLSSSTEKAGATKRSVSSIAALR